MKKAIAWFAACLCYLSFSAGAIAQQIAAMFPEGGVAYCGGTEVTLAFSATGEFSATNRFKVQISGVSGASFTDLPGEYAIGMVKIRLPESASFSSQTTHRLRVVSTSPVVVSNESEGFRMVSLPSAEVVGNSRGSQYANAGSPVNLLVRLSGGRPYSFTLQDSTRLFESSDSNRPAEYELRPTQTTEYTIASVSNACGSGKTSGSTTVYVNRDGFRVTSVSAREICAGNPLQVGFSSNEPLPDDTQFEVELNDRLSRWGLTLPVEGNTSPLTVQIPTTIPSGEYYLTLRSINAKLEHQYAFPSPNESTGILYVLNGITATLSGTPSIPFGKEARLDLDIKGTANFPRISLDDGRLLTNTPTFVWVRPDESRTYQIQSIVTSCGQGIGQGSARVTVTPGIHLDSLSSYRVCAGARVTAYYRSSPGKPVASSVKLWFGPARDAYGNVKGQDGAQFVAAEQQGNGMAVFTLPAQLPERYHYLQLEAGPDLSSYHDQVMLVLNKPAIRLNTQQRTLDIPSLVQIDYRMDGLGNDLQFTLSDGRQFRVPDGQHYSGSFSVFVPQTTTYSVTEVRNQCGIGTASGVETVVVRDQTARQIHLTSPTDTYCTEGNLQLHFNVSGTYSPDVRYRLEISNSWGDFSGGSSLATVTSPGYITAHLPQKPGSYLLRIRSSAPEVISNEVWIRLDETVPTLELFGNVRTAGLGGRQLTIVPGEIVHLGLSFKGLGPFYYELNDGTRGETTEHFLSIPVTPGQATEYKVQRLEGRCRTGRGHYSVEVTIKPYQLFTGNLPVQACAGGQIQVPFGFSGILPPELKFIVQARSVGGTFVDLPTSGNSSPLTATLPMDLPNGFYYLRVVGVQGDQTIAGLLSTQPLIIQRPSRAVLSNGSGGTTQLTGGGSVPLFVQFSETGGPYTIQFNDGSVHTTTSITSSAQFQVNPKDDFTYTIRSVAGPCGYGGASGSVAVSLVPALVSMEVIKPEAVCRQAKLRIRYRTVGRYPEGNRFRFFLRAGYEQWDTNGGQLVAETTERSGELAVDLPPNLPLGEFTLRFVATSRPNSVLRTYFTVRDVPSADLSGSTTIYAGQATAIRGKFSGSSRMEILFSDATRQMLGNADNQLIIVSPSVTTNYQVVAVRNVCGWGSGMGEATVTVLPTSARGITNTQLTDMAGNSLDFICQQKPVQLHFNQQGTFQPDTRYRLQVSDASGQNFRDAGVEATSSPLTFTLGSTVVLPPGDDYRFRIVATSPMTIGSAIGVPIRVEAAISGKLAGSTMLTRGDSTRLTVTLTGSPPWYLELTEPSRVRSFSNIRQNPFVLSVAPTLTTLYRLTSVGNTACGVGTAQGIALVSLNDCEEITTVRSGSWDDPAVWNCGQVPSPDDHVLVRHVLIVPIGKHSVGSFRLESGGSLHLAVNAQLEVRRQ